MRTLHLGLRVRDLDRSLAFYTALGYEVVGSVPETEIGHLVMLKLPADEFVTIELVYSPEAAVPRESRLSHFVISVESMDSTVSALGTKGIEVETPTSPDDSEKFLTTLVEDPDGNRIELVQWPPGHAAGMAADDFPP